MIRIQDQVIGNRVTLDHAELMTIFRNVRDARVDQLARRGISHLLPGQSHLATEGMSQAGQGLDQFSLAVALHAGDAQHFSGMDFKRDTGHGFMLALVLDAQTFHLQHGLFRLGVFFLHGQIAPRGPPSSTPGCVHPICCGVGLADDAAAAQHRNAVGDGQHFLQLVGDEDDRDAALRQFAHDAEQIVGFLRRQHRRRLVQDQDVGVAVERLDDLDALLHAHRQIADDGVGIDVQPVLLRQLADALAAAAPIERADR